ncbi:hypothetical protein Tco_0583402 [Tanacetum coccineum]
MVNKVTQKKRFTLLDRSGLLETFNTKEHAKYGDLMVYTSDDLILILNPAKEILLKMNLPVTGRILKRRSRGFKQKIEMEHHRSWSNSPPNAHTLMFPSKDIKHNE